VYVPMYVHTHTHTHTHTHKEVDKEFRNIIKKYQLLLKNT